MNDLITFYFQEKEIRTVLKNSEPWFVAKDVCDYLEISNSRDAISNINDDWKDDVGITDTIGRMQKTSIINEPAVYKLVFRSRKPEAEKFTEWLASKKKKDDNGRCQICDSVSTCPLEAVERFVSAKGIIAEPMWEKGNSSDPEGVLYNLVLKELSTASLFGGTADCGRIKSHLVVEGVKNVELMHVSMCSYGIYKIIPKSGKIIIKFFPTHNIPAGYIIGREGENIKRVEKLFLKNFNMNINIHIEIEK